jgi:hypothetical protein
MATNPPVDTGPVPPAFNLTADNLLALLLASERTDLLWIWEQWASNITHCWACNAERPDNEDDCPNCGVSCCD